MIQLTKMHFAANPYGYGYGAVAGMPVWPFGAGCGQGLGDPDLGPYMCVSAHLVGATRESTLASAGLGGPALLMIPSLLAALFVILSVGFLAGFFRARAKTYRGSISRFDSPEAYRHWRYERNTTVLTFTMIVSGLLFSVFGVSGNIELALPYAKIITSLPGLVLILFGYLFWIKRYRTGTRFAPEDPAVHPREVQDTRPEAARKDSSGGL